MESVSHFVVLTKPEEAMDFARALKDSIACMIGVARNVQLTVITMEKLPDVSAISHT